MLANVFISLIALAAALGLVLLLAGSGWWAAAAIFVFGAAGFSLAAALNGRVFAFAGAAPTLAAGINVSAFNLGNAAGPWLGGLVIGAGLGLRAPLWTALALVAVALVLAAGSAVLERRPTTGVGAGDRAASESGSGTEQAPTACAAACS